MTMTKDKFTYIPQGVCSKRFDFELEGDVITNVVITGGCPGPMIQNAGSAAVNAATARRSRSPSSRVKLSSKKAGGSSPGKSSSVTASRSAR